MSRRHGEAVWILEAQPHVNSDLPEFLTRSVQYVALVLQKLRDQTELGGIQGVLRFLGAFRMLFSQQINSL